MKIKEKTTSQLITLGGACIGYDERQEKESMRGMV